MTKSQPEATECLLSNVKAAAFLAVVLLAATACSDDSRAPDETETIAGETYEEFDTRRDALDGSRGTFAGQGCTQDCSGHEAGYAWAEEKGITDPAIHPPSIQCGDCPNSAIPLVGNPVGHKSIIP